MYYFYCPSLLNASSPWLNSSADSLESLNSLKETEHHSETKQFFTPTIIQTHQASTISEEAGTQDFIPESKSEKVNAKESRRSQDGDYNPNCEVVPNLKKSKQLENRNVVPNIIRLVLSFVQKRGKSSKLVEDLIARSGCQPASAKRFFLLHKLVKGKMNNYVNEDTLKELLGVRCDNFEIYGHEEQQCYQRITRKLVFYFLTHEAVSCVLTSKRMEESKKQQHVSAIRAIASRLSPALDH